jgi:hypothetical protein
MIRRGASLAVLDSRLAETGAHSIQFNLRDDGYGADAAPLFHVLNPVPGCRTTSPMTSTATAAQLPTARRDTGPALSAIHHGPCCGAASGARRLSADVGKESEKDLAPSLFGDQSGARWP